MGAEARVCGAGVAVTRDVSKATASRAPGWSVSVCTGLQGRVRQAV